MDEETKKKFTAPWFYDRFITGYEVCDVHGFEICATNNESSAKLIVLIPEMYDELNTLNKFLKQNNYLFASSCVEKLLEKINKAIQ